MIIINSKPMSVNQAWQGRRFKTQLYKNYEEDLSWQIKLMKLKTITGWVNVEYRFYIKNFLRSDAGNFEKPLTDILVKNGLIEDDKFIKRLVIEKFKSDEEKIEIEIYEN
jgi:Holliday junction resolvase RusA-like endonuclease